ncbi:hypothetical protein NDU88_004709 [Pleurodeles waltl]|uniref:Uncharacterized protein n=1 Tax=Pleurodeles waltl TaxID=8319 RepID=A0AAV7RKB2_PLEWA|nr:hypothetical protein NDU88_004709 [Pleurodeles waltl]
MAAVAPPLGSAPRRSLAWARRWCRRAGGARSGSPLRLRVSASQERRSDAPLRVQSVAPPRRRWLPQLHNAAGSPAVAPPGRSITPGAANEVRGSHTEQIPLRCWILAPQERPAAVERRARDGALN